MLKAVRNRNSVTMEQSAPSKSSAMGVADWLRSPTAFSIKYSAQITVWNHNDLGMAPENCGLAASPTQVLRSFTPAPKGKGEMASGSVKDMAKTLVDRLSEKHLI